MSPATASQGDDASRERFEKGAAIRRHVLGDEYVDEAMSPDKLAGRDFQKLVTEYVWGGIWARPELSMATRSLITLAVLTTLNQAEELALHVDGAIKNGCTHAEIEEAVIHAGAYCGASATATALRIVNRVFSRRVGES